MEENYIQIELKLLIVAVFKKWWIVLASMLCFIGAAFLIITRLITPIYSAQSTLFIGKDPGIVASISISDVNMNNELVSDYRELIQSRTITEEVIELVSVNINHDQLVENLDIYTSSGTRFMYIAYKDTSRTVAAEVANTFSDVLLVRAEEIVGVKNIKIVDYAIPPMRAVNDNFTVNLIIAGIFGLLFGVFIVFLILFFNNNIRTEADVESVLGLPVIGNIPTFKGEDRKDDK